MLGDSLALWEIKPFVDAGGGVEKTLDSSAGPHVALCGPGRHSITDVVQVNIQSLAEAKVAYSLNSSNSLLIGQGEKSNAPRIRTPPAKKCRGEWPIWG